MNNEQNRQELILAFGLVTVGVFTRVLFNKLGVYNFNAVMASALFAGAYLSDRKLSLAVPIAALFLTDLVIGFYDWKLMVIVYGAFVFTMFLGRAYRSRPTKLNYGLS